MKKYEFNDDFELDDDSFNEWLNGVNDLKDDEETILPVGLDDDFNEDDKRPSCFGGYKPLKKDKKNYDKSTKPLPLRFCEYEPDGVYQEEFLEGKKVVQVPFFKLLTIEDKTQDWVKYFKTIKYLNKDVKTYIIIAVLKSFLIDIIEPEKFDFLISFLYDDVSKIDKKDLYTKVRKIIFNNNLLRVDYLGNKEYIKKYKDGKISKISATLQLCKGDDTIVKVLDCYNNYSKDVNEIGLKLNLSKRRVYQILKENNLETKPIKKKNLNDKIVEYIDDKMKWSNEPISNKSICNDLSINSGVLSRFFKVYQEYKEKIELFNDSLNN